MHVLRSLLPPPDVPLVVPFSKEAKHIEPSPLTRAVTLFSPCIPCRTGFVRRRRTYCTQSVHAYVSRPSQGKDSHSLRTHSVHYHPTSHLTPRHFGGTPLHHLTRSGCRGSRRIGEAITTFNLPLASAPRLGLLAEEGGRCRSTPAHCASCLGEASLIHRFLAFPAALSCLIALDFLPPPL